MKTDGVLPRRTRLRSSKYLNNLIEQDHRGIKSRTRPMLGFKSFSSAAITIAGVELLRRIHKDNSPSVASASKTTAAPALWNAVLAA
jgi:transposase-like protein